MGHGNCDMVVEWIATDPIAVSGRVLGFEKSI